MSARASDIRQIAIFVAVGLVATFVHYVILIVLVQLVGEPVVPATLLGFCAGGLISYRLNRALTFRSDRPHAEAVWRFAIVAGIAFLATFALMAFAVDLRHWPYLPSQVATTAVVTVWTFAANRFWTFSR